MATGAAEAQFLEGRKTRADTFKPHTERRRRTDDLHSFWASVKGFRAAWSEQLDRLSIQPAAPTDTAGDRSGDAAIDATSTVTISNIVRSLEGEKRRIHLGLCRLQDELEHHRKQCFAHAASSDNVNESKARNENIDTDSFPVLLIPPQELPLSDLRLLHTEFSQCRAALDQKRNELLPKGKFVFRRFREAVRLRGRQEKEIPAVAVQGSRLSKSVAPSLQPSLSQDHRSSKHTLDHLRDSTIEVHADGRVVVRSKEGHAADDRRLEALDSSPLVLSNLDKTDIFIHDGGCTALHLFKVTNTTVTVDKPVRTVHVTDCHQLTLYLESQQLRLHESTDLYCHVKISAGAILEDSTRLRFYHNADTDGTLDVRDFNWLRSGVPSPNFSIEKAMDMERPFFQSNSSSSSNDTKRMAHHISQAFVANTATPADKVAEVTGGGDDDDDDDEEL